MHPYLVIISLSNPQVKGNLGSKDDNADYMVLPDQCEALWLDVVVHIITYCLEHNVCTKTNNTDLATGGAIEKPAAVNTVTLDEEELMFGGTETMKRPHKLAEDTDQDTFRQKMEMEKDLCLQMPRVELH